MNANDPVPSAVSWFRQNPLLLGLLALAAVGLAAWAFQATRPAKVQSSYYEVQRGDFLISIVEGGTVEAVNEIVVRSEVEGTARIVFIVPEGSIVKKGELLVGLDSSASQDAVNQQQINVEKAQFAYIQAEQQYEIQKSIVDSEIQAAALKMEFAQSDLDKYVKGEALQLRRNAQIEITNVLETLQIAEDTLEWTKTLHQQGYETKNKLDTDQLKVSQTKLNLEKANQALWMLLTFDEPKKKRELEALLQEAKENLERVKLQGERKLEQCQADVQTQKSTLDLSKLKLERDKKQLDATKIFAPQDGLVVYAGGGDRRFSSESMIEEGAVIRYRQEIIKLPDVSEMKLLVKVHESYINQVRIGQPAYVVLDAMPDQRFRGEVNRVAPLPDSQSRWSNPNLKVYATSILITDPLPNVKPGVSARAEIVITNLEKVLTVPIQAVTTRKGQQVVFLASDTSQPVPVTVGMYNTKFIEITSGLKEGARVLLSPPFDTDTKDLGGAILANGETPPAEFGTNRVPRATARFPGNGERGEPANGSPADERRPGGRVGRAPGPDSAGALNGMNREATPGTGAKGPPGGGRFNREEMMRQFDTNGDGQLDENEQAALRERFGRGRRSTTNANAESFPPRPDASR